jgi:bifunctional non-homologous end joining protein LigD
MSLREYKRKRDFKKTPEPAGAAAKRRAGRQFVIQKHDASRLHYDFRLELAGTLKSWAVPKGPSLDPKVKALAVHVEDHPLEYATFEGVIPPGQYGGGTVMVWDRGTWEPEEDPERGYRAGKLKFRLDGEKLHGSWALVRMGGRAGEDGKSWLLIKHDDKAAKPTNKYDVLKREPRSVATNRDLDEIAADADRVWTKDGEQKPSKRKRPAAKSAKKSSRQLGKKPARKSASASRSKMIAQSLGDLAGARRAKQPTSLSPQLATLATSPPAGDGWFHELKFDGYRILAFLHDGRVKLISRNGKDWTKRFVPVADAAAELPVSQAILDGEVVALDEHGVSDFQRLQNALKSGDADSLAYYVFDLPYCNGYDLTAVPLGDRKDVLTAVLNPEARNDGVIRYSDHIVGSGEAVLEEACKMAREGIVCKRADAPYEQARSRWWLKVKCLQRQEFVIGGFTKPTGSRTGFGALLLGYYRDGKLVYSGRVGTGFTDASLKELHSKLKALRTDAAPFKSSMTTAQRRGATWVKPELVAEVEFTEWTDEGLLRHPSFQGLREDKPAKQIVREEAVPMSKVTRSAKNASRKRTKGAKSASNGSGSVEVAGVAISHPDRVLYPEMGLTKQDLAEYYESIADWILPHVVDRPLTLVRCPGGRAGQCFYQKHLADEPPEHFRGVSIKEKSGTDEYVVIDDLAGLVSLVQMGVLEIHPWPARADKVEAPDRLIFDLDPGEGVPWKDVVVAAREVRDCLGELGLESFLRTSGGKGLHVVAPLARRNSWDELKAFAKAVAELLVREAPDRYIATMSKAKRRGKVFVDYLRNQRGATAIACYSTRAREGAPVAAPLAWDELTARLKPNGFTVKNMPQRLGKLQADPWAGFFDARQSITRAMAESVS